MHNDKVQYIGLFTAIVGFLGLIGVLWHLLGWAIALALLCALLILCGFALMGS